MKTLKFFIGVSIVACLLQTCRKDEDSVSDSVDEATLQKESMADITTDSDIDMAMDLSQSYGLMNKTAGQNPNYPCADITLETTNGDFPKTITVDFGSAGCTSPNGITRKGKIYIKFSDKIRTVGSVITIIRDNYYINSNKVEGTLVFTNITTDASVPAWTKVVNDGKVTHPDGTYFQFTTNRKQKMIEGASTPLILSDDIFEIYEGSQNITRSNGTYLNTTVKTSLIKKNSCQYISKGTVSLKGSVLDGTLDFGNGDCDNQAIYTNSKGVSHQITL